MIVERANKKVQHVGETSETEEGKKQREEREKTNRLRVAFILSLLLRA